MDLLITIAAFVAALELLVAVHEGGHYVVARLCGVKVLRFSLGFGPVVWKRTSRSGTEFALSLLPLGGYVKMVDSRDPDLEVDARRNPEGDFDRKPLWQRAAVVFAGPFMNLAFALVIFWGIGMAGVYELSGKLAEPPAGTPAAAAGIRGGETVTEIGGRAVKSYSDLRISVFREAGTVAPLTLRGEGGGAASRSIDLTGIDFSDDPAKVDVMDKAGLHPWAGPVLIADVIAGSAAEAAGLVKGDEVKALDGEAVKSPGDFVKRVRPAAGRDVTVAVSRNGEEKTLVISVPEATDESTGEKVGRIGVRIGSTPDVVRVQLGPVESLTSGFGKVWDAGALMVRVFGEMVLGEASVKNISGPVAIADYAGKAVQFGLIPFLYFLATISISLGVLNLLPIPVLDGGHLAGYAYEAVMRRRPPESVSIAAQRVGIMLILLLTAVALFNDVVRIAGG